MTKINSLSKLKKWNKNPTTEKPYIVEWFRDYFEGLLEKGDIKKAYDAFNAIVEFTEKCEKLSKEESLERVSTILNSKKYLDRFTQNDNPEDKMSFNEWFGLSRASWLTVPRIVLESMPIEWQHKFTNLLMEMNTTFDWKPDDMSFQVSAKVDNKFVRMPYLLSDYRRANIEHLRKKMGKQ